jgi:hypothetical protein
MGRNHPRSKGNKLSLYRYMLLVKLIRNDIFMFLPCLIVCVDFEIIYLICLHPIRINYCCMCIILFNEDNNYYCNIKGYLLDIGFVCNQEEIKTVCKI